MKLLLVLAVLVGGCSWGVRATHPATVERCSSSWLWPSLDAGVAVGSVGLLGYELARVSMDGPSDSRARLMGPALMSAVVVGTAAISGYTWASDCRRVRERRPVALNP